MSTLSRPADWNDPVTLPTISAPQRVLVPFDGSHNSERALAWAALLAQPAQAEVIVVVAYEQPLTVRGRGAIYVDEVRSELTEEAMELAREAVDVLKAEGVNARGIVVRGEVSSAILETATDIDAHVIVIGRHGLTAELHRGASALDRVRELIQGGVAEKITRHAHVPVVVVA